MTLVSVTQVQNIICDITNLAISQKGFSKGDIQKRLVYEIRIMPRVKATEEQMLDILGESKVKFDFQEI